MGRWVMLVSLTYLLFSFPCEAIRNDNPESCSLDPLHSGPCSVHGQPYACQNDHAHDRLDPSIHSRPCSSSYETCKSGGGYYRDPYQAMVSTLKLPDSTDSYTLCEAGKAGPLIGVTIECIDSSTDNTTVSRVVTISISGLDLSSGVLPNLVMFTQLEHLVLRGNQIGGTIPPSFGELSKLKILDLSSNKLQGHIPDTLGVLFSLESLHLYRNFLSGEIPQSLKNLTNLKSMRFEENNLQGNLSYFFDELINLGKINLGDNNFSGNLPRIGHLKELSHLNLGDNNFSGNLPWSIGHLKELSHLNVAANKLTGTIPSTYLHLRGLLEFSVAGNNLDGPIPYFIGEWGQLERLKLMGNNFTSPLPPEIFSLGKLKVLWVSDLIETAAYDVLPTSANFSSSIYSLILRNCSIRGEIPEYIGNMKGLYHLDLSLNNFHGGLPDSLQKIGGVKMSFAGNQLGGKFPYWVSELNYTSRLVDLSENDFYINSTRPRIRPDMNFFGCCKNSTFPYNSHPQKILERHCPSTQDKDT